ncbi:MAG TPA: ELWxxDGT repeat protein [Chitinophagaceae bacterium]|nr:ELWxxDGT repeat protein [Chitinophagaceae bacterium]
MKRLIYLFLSTTIFLPSGKATGQISFKEYPCNTAGYSFPWALSVYKGDLIFGAYGNSGGHEFWSCNGSTTNLVKDINPGDASAQPNFFRESGGKLFFNADDGVHGRELWIYDKSGGGPVLYKDIHSGTTGSNPKPLATYKDQLYFFINELTVGTQLRFTNSSMKGVDRVEGVYFQSSQPTVFKEQLFFTGSETPYTYQSELWVTDGSTSAKKVIDIYPGDSGSNPNYYFVFKDKLYFSANNKTNGFELWVSDGTSGGTKLFMDINPGAGHSSPYSFTEHEGKLFFVADDGTHGRELWISDGTVAGTHMVKDINTYIGSVMGSDPAWMTSYKGKLYFNAFDISAGRELWCTDGTETGTRLVKDIYPGSNPAWPAWLIVYGSKLYFTASHSDTLGQQLFQTDGTDTGTVMLYPSSFPLRKDMVTSYPFLTLFNDKLFFVASYNNNYSQLWSIEDRVLSVPKTTAAGFLLYPNPTKGIVTLEKAPGNSTITVTNVLGQALLSVHTEPAPSVQRIDLSGFANGLYTISIRNGEQQITKVSTIVKNE